MPVTLDGNDYPHIEGTLSANITHLDSSHTLVPSQTYLYWFLEIEAINELNTNEETGAYGQLVDPVRFYFEGISFPDEVSSWKKLGGHSITWDRPEEVGIEGSRPGLYLWSHRDIERAVLRVVEREGITFRIQWEGVTGYGDFSIDTWVPFESLHVHHQEGENAREILSRHLAPEDFIELPSPPSYWSGVTTPFAPKVAEEC